MVLADQHAAYLRVIQNVNNIIVTKAIEKMRWDFSHGNILDYGCGTGGIGEQFIYPKLVETNSNLYGVDISEDMVNYARENHPHKHVTYDIGCLPSTKFPFGHMSFDAITCINVFHYVQDIQPLLVEFQKLLKPGGQIGFTASGHSSFLQIFPQLLKSPKWGKYMTGLKEQIPRWIYTGTLQVEEYYHRLFTEGTGLKMVHFEIKNICGEHKLEDATALLMSINPCIKNVPKDELPALKDEYSRLLTTIMNAPANAQSIHAPAQVMYGVLEKPEC